MDLEKEGHLTEGHLTESMSHFSKQEPCRYLLKLFDRCGLTDDEIFSLSKEIVEFMKERDKSGWDDEESIRRAKVTGKKLSGEAGRLFPILVKGILSGKNYDEEDIPLTVITRARNLRRHTSTLVH